MQDRAGSVIPKSFRDLVRVALEEENLDGFSHPTEPCQCFATDSGFLRCLHLKRPDPLMCRPGYEVNNVPRSPFIIGGKFTLGDKPFVYHRWIRVPKVCQRCEGSGSVQFYVDYEEGSAGEETCPVCHGEGVL